MKKKLLSVLLCVCMAMGLLPTTALATSKTADDAIAWARSQVGHSVGYDDGSGYYQCVEFIQAYYQWLGAGTPSGNGADYATNALPSGWTRTPGGIPQKGDILVYSRYSDTVQQHGHVAIYESDNVLYDQDGSVCGATVKREEKNYRTYTYNYWGCIHPNFAPTVSAPTVTFSPWSNSNYTYTWETDASIGQEITVTNGSCTETGMYLYDANGRELASARNPSYTLARVYFQVNAECGYTLTPGTTYKYKFYAVVNGKTYWSEEYPLQTSGTAPAPVKITAIANPANGGTVTGSGRYDGGKTVTVKATPSEGYRFVSWTVNGNTVSTSASYSFVANTDQTLTATFDKKEPAACSITVISSDGGTATGGGSYKKGDTATVIAIPDKGYKFVGWIVDNRDGKMNSNASNSFTVNSDQTWEAIFWKQTYIISTAASPSDAGMVSGNGQYNYESEATITAVPNKGYVFKAWTESGSTVSTGSSYAFTVDRSRDLIAVFEKEGAVPPTVTVWPAASAINYGQKLPDSQLSGGKADAAGTFRWADTTLRPVSGQSYEVIFTPSDTAKYSTVTGKVSMTVNKTAPILSLSARQSGTSVIVDVSAVNPYDSGLSDVPTPTVTYRIGSKAAQKISGTSFTIPQGTAEGTVITVTASTAGDKNYTAAEKSTTLKAGSLTVHHVLTTSGSDLGGSVTIQPATAKQGETVTVTATARSGYVFDTITAEAANGAAVWLTALGGGSYTFTMPDSNVTLDVAFKATQEDWVNPFSDVVEGAWYYEAVKFVNQSGLMNGSDGKFDHSGNLSRAMIAQILYNKENCPEVPDDQVFSDVPRTAWYFDAVSWAAEQGIVRGYEDGSFAPDASITREQLAAVLWRYAGSPVSGGGTLNFTDANRVGSWALDAVKWAVESGIISGKGGGILDPQGPATRAQVAQMLKNYLDK